MTAWAGEPRRLGLEESLQVLGLCSLHVEHQLLLSREEGAGSRGPHVRKRVRLLCAGGVRPGATRGQRGCCDLSRGAAGPDFRLGQGFAEVRALGGCRLAPWRLWGAAGLQGAVGSTPGP